MPPYKVKLPRFEGPLDLLLHLIRQHEYDIFDIPIAQLAKEYAAYVDLMKSLNLEVAGEFLVMAATLMQLKSRMLLPRHEGIEGEEGDPREALVRQLLEHQRFQEAGRALGERNQLGRDLFARGGAHAEEDAAASDGPPLGEVGAFELLSALRKVLERLPEQAIHEIFAERISLADKIAHVMERLGASGSAGFEELFSEVRDRFEVVITFLAVLELVKMRAVRLHQAESFGPIRVYAAEAEEGAAPPEAAARP